MRRAHGSRPNASHHDSWNAAEQDVQRDPALALAAQLCYRVGRAHAEHHQVRHPGEEAAGTGAREDVGPRGQQLRPALQEEDSVRAVRRAAAATGVRRQAQRPREEQGETSEQRLRHPQAAHTPERGGGAGAAGQRRLRQRSQQEAEQSGDAATGG